MMWLSHVPPGPTISSYHTNSGTYRHIHAIPKSFQGWSQETKWLDNEVNSMTKNERMVL